MKPKSTQQPWWNRPLFGGVSLWDRIIGILYRKQISELTLSLYDEQVEAIAKLEPTLRMLDRDEYSGEFLSYMKIKQKVDYQLDEYESLSPYIKVFDFVIRQMKYFQTISRIELDFRGKTQINLYDDIADILNSSKDNASIKRSVLEKVQTTIDKTRNVPMKQAMASYQSALNSILKKEADVINLNFLKQKDIRNYAIFDTIYVLVKKARKLDIKSLKIIKSLVKEEEHKLIKLTQKIHFPADTDINKNYAKVIRYLILYYRYEKMIFRFEQLLDKVCQWYHHYQIIQEIRQDYPQYKYHVPNQFKEKILAAKRANIKEIILCADNKKDIDEIKESYLKGLKFHYVTEMSEVIQIALTKQKAKNAKKLI